VTTHEVFSWGVRGGGRMEGFFIFSESLACFFFPKKEMKKGNLLLFCKDWVLGLAGSSKEYEVYWHQRRGEKKSKEKKKEQQQRKEGRARKKEGSQRRGKVPSQKGAGRGERKSTARSPHEKKKVAKGPQYGRKSPEATEKRRHRR